jgi:competence protein ComEC
VIPVSNLILFIGTAMCALGEVSLLNDKIGWCFSHLLWLLNKFIFWIDSIPFALIQGISITMFEMVLLYILIFLLCWLTEERRTKVLIASLYIVFGLCSFYSYERITKAQQKKIVVYCTTKQSAIAFIDGKKALTAFDEKLLQDQSAMMFHVKHHWWDCGVKREEKVSSKQLAIGKLIQFEGKRVLVVDSALEKTEFVLDKKLKVDLLIHQRFE